MTTQPPGIPGDVTVIPAPQPMDAAAVTTAAAQVLIDARAAGIPQPDYVQIHPGPIPSADLQFSPGNPDTAWDHLRAWARHRLTTITAKENRTHPGTYIARVTWTHDGIDYDAYAHITTPPPGQDTTP